MNHVSETMNNERKNYLIAYLIIFLFTIAFVVFCSTSTSPLAPYYYGADSAYFQSDGKIWANGQVPYRDFFDHKGPVLLFLNMLAYLTPYPKYLLCIFQSMFLSCFFCFEYGCLRTETGAGKRQKLVTMMLIVVSFFHVAITMGEGNNTELYCLAPCFIPFWNELKWIKSGIEIHDIKMAFADGVGLGIIFLINAKNSFPLCLLILMVIMTLISARKLKELMLNIAAGLAGVMLIFLPFCIYFICNNALYDMLYATFLFNFRYLSASGTYEKEWYKLIAFSLPELLVLFGVLPGLLLSKSGMKHERFFRICVLLSIVITEGYLLSGMAYKHYFMMGVIFIPVFILVADKYQGRNFALSVSVLCVLTALMTVVIIGHTLPWYMDLYSGKRQEENRLNIEKTEFLLSLIPEEKRDEVFVYQVSGKELYAVSELEPIQRFPYLTEFYETIDPAIRLEVRERLDKLSPEYIIAGCVGDEYISNILSEKYVVIYEDNLTYTDFGKSFSDYICLYRLKAE